MSGLIRVHWRPFAVEDLDEVPPAGRWNPVAIRVTNRQPASGMNDEPETSQVRNRLKLERLELALRASNEGIWDWWTDQPTIFYSRRILEFLECGKDRAPNLFRPPFDHIWVEEREAFERGVSLALRDGGPETLAVDARVRTGGGTWRWLRIRGTVVRNRDGQPIRIAGSMIDISRRKAVEAQVEDERYLLKQFGRLVLHFNIFLKFA